jgi:hypothetical protein
LSVTRSEALRLERGGDSEAAPLRDGLKLKPATLLWPLYHGDNCIGLSGLYAILNAIRLAIAHKQVLTEPELYRIMRAGLRFLEGRLTPVQLLSSGLRVNLWRSMAEAMTEVTLREAGAWARVEPVFVSDPGVRAAFDAIEDAIERLRPVMMLCRGGRYTVVSGYTASSLLLFDSAGSCWIKKHVCGVPGDCDSARHVLYPASFLAVSA